MERRRRLEEKTQYDLRSRETAAALNTNLAPPFRTGTAGFATSAVVAEKVADVPDAADVMTGAVGKTAAAAAKKTRAQRAAEAKAAKAAAASVNAANRNVKVGNPTQALAASQNPSESTSQIMAARVPIDLDRDPSGDVLPASTEKKRTGKSRSKTPARQSKK